MKTFTALLPSVCTLASACLLSTHSVANDKLEEIIITSSRVEMPLRKIGTSVSVLSGQEITDRGYASLADVLRSQPAIAVTNAGGAGKATALRIRGESGYRTRVFLDGIDISDTSGTQVSTLWEHMQSAGIEKVEILRGPQGLMYGADAGGVVNIQSQRTDSGISGGLSAEGGRYDTRQLAGYVGGGNGTVDFNLSVADFQTDGFNSRTTGTVLRDDDGYENTALHGRLGWNAGDDLRFEFIAHDVNADNEYDACFSNITFSTVDDCTDTFDQSSYRATVEIGAGPFTHQLAYSDSSSEREFFSEGLSSFGADGGRETVEYLGSWAGSEVLNLVYGVDFETQSIDDGSVDTERDQIGYYLEYQGAIGDRFFTTVGVRYDDNDDFGNHTSFRVSATYLMDVSGGELKLKGTYGTGFRAPSLYEISYNSGPFASPPASNVDLVEETSEGFDLGLAYYSDGGTVLEAVYFDQNIEDLIDFDLILFSGYIQLPGESSSRGVELIADIPMSASWFLLANYTYTDAEDPNGEQRLRAPKHLANLGLSFRPSGGDLAINLYIRSSRDTLDTVAGTTVELGDYEVVNLSARYQLMESLEIFARVENLFDEEYEEVATYNTSGTAAYAGVRYAF